MAITQQTRSLQPEPVRNPVTPLSSVIQSLPAQQMAGAAAIRRAGKTAANFQPSALMERLDMLLEDKEPKEATFRLTPKEAAQIRTQSLSALSETGEIAKRMDTRRANISGPKDKQGRSINKEAERLTAAGFVPRVVFEKK